MASNGAAPSLLVAPASLLANWAAEIERFAPSLRVRSPILRRCRPSELKALGRGALGGVDLVITSYGTLLRLPWLAETAGDWPFSTRRRRSRTRTPSRQGPSRSSKAEAASR